MTKIHKKYQRIKTTPSSIDLEFSVDPKVLFHGWWVFSYLHVRQSSGCWRYVKIAVKSTRNFHKQLSHLSNQLASDWFINNAIKWGCLRSSHSVQRRRKEFWFTHMCWIMKPSLQKMELLSLKQESNVCIVCHNNYFTCTLQNSGRSESGGKWKESWGGGGGRVSRTNYLDGPILVDIANIQIITFASVFSLFAPSILINQHILFF